MTIPMSGALLAICSLALAGCGLSVDKSAQSYRAGAAQARTADYMQAQRSGDMLGMCVKSNLVSAAYRDAGDEANAQAWITKNAEDCRAARKALLPDEEMAD